MSARIDRLVLSGQFSLDGGTWDVDNNVWILGDDDECVIFDAPHDAQAIAKAVEGRRVLAIICTHAHDDHVAKAPELATLVDAPIWLHPADLELWALTHPGIQPDVEVTDGMTTEVAGVELEALHTPGHSPGGTSWYVPDLGVLFSGDTLFNGGPGATGRSFSDRGTLEASIKAKLFPLPGDTVVHTGHGDDTTIAAEQEGSASW